MRTAGSRLELEDGTGPNEALECCRGRDMVGFIVLGWKRWYSREERGSQVEEEKGGQVEKELYTKTAARAV